MSFNQKRMSPGKIWVFGRIFRLPVLDLIKIKEAILNFCHPVAPGPRRAVYPALFLMKVTVCLKGLIYTSLEEFENAALILRLGHTFHNYPTRKRSFSKTLWRNFKTPAWCFSVDRKYWNKYLFDNHDITIIMWFCCPRFPQKQLVENVRDCSVFIILLVVGTANIWWVFKEKNFFDVLFKFLRRNVDRSDVKSKTKIKRRISQIT